MDSGGSVSLCIFGVVRNYLLGYLMYLWLNPVMFLVLPCRGRGWQLFPGAGGCSSLFPAPPSPCLAVSSCSPSEVTCALGIVTSCTDDSVPGLFLPGSSFSSLGLVGAAPSLESGQGVGLRVKFSPRLSRSCWKPTECSESCQLHWESQT